MLFDRRTGSVKDGRRSLSPFVFPFGRPTVRQNTHRTRLGRGAGDSSSVCANFSNFLPEFACTAAGTAWATKVGDEIPYVVYFYRRPKRPRHSGPCRGKSIYYNVRLKKKNNRRRGGRRARSVWRERERSRRILLNHNNNNRNR